MGAVSAKCLCRYVRYSKGTLFDFFIPFYLIDNYEITLFSGPQTLRWQARNAAVAAIGKERWKSRNTSLPFPLTLPLYRFAGGWSRPLLAPSSHPQSLSSEPSSPDIFFESISLDTDDFSEPDTDNEDPTTINKTNYFEPAQDIGGNRPSVIMVPVKRV